MNIEKITETLIRFNHIEEDIRNLRTIAESILTANNDDDALAEIIVQVERPLSDQQKAQRKKTGTPRSGFIMMPGKPAQSIADMDMEQIGKQIQGFINQISGEDYKNNSSSDDEYETISSSNLYKPETSIAIIGLLITDLQNARKLCLHRLTQLGVSLPTI